jgi:hypothetical protein
MPSIHYSYSGKQLVKKNNNNSREFFFFFTEGGIWNARTTHFINFLIVDDSGSKC